MPESLGARLRKQREERQIDLGSIAEQTKIKRSLLEALERDDVSRWPSGIFRRAYVRTYAHIIGLDPDAVLREFLEVYPEPVDALEAAAAAAVEETARRNAAAPIRLRTIVDSAIGSLARLRRPGASDGPGATAAPVNGPAPTVVDPPAVAPQGTVGTLADASVPQAPDHGPQPSAHRPMPDPTEDIVVDVVVCHEAAVPDDGRERAGASSRGSDGPADAGSDETRALIDSRLEAVANLCTDLGRVGGRDEVLLLLEGCARALDATGLIVWLWDESSEALRPALVHGYSDQVLAHLPRVRRDADNATAEAFRSARTCEVAAASAWGTGALVVPLLMPEGCAGVLAVELQPGIMPPGSFRALATVLAAALAQFVHRSRPFEQQAPISEPADSTRDPAWPPRQTDEMTAASRGNESHPSGAAGHNR